ncbi:alpha/beta fold hydrolase [Amycolatopsis anabasis]|uniref:alpha/beta fold hydrolase n=1 Tax=Amycolatopsis anabasis TaxID=1840409 RepID=UPI0015D1B986|nr:alpha/beta hydrolase [Amycolatopsis anabasis]
MRRGRTELPGERMLGWAEWGPEHGTPVLFCPGAGTSRHLGFGADVLDELAIRLISLDRPGLGASDPDPGRTLLSWAADVDAFAEREQLGEFGIVANSQGTPFALACAAAGIGTAVAAAAIGDELAHPAVIGLLEPDVRAMVDAVAADPDGFAASFAERADARTLAELTVTMSSETDRRVYTDPAFAPHYRRALEEGFAQGPGGYVRDLVLTMSRWPFDPAKITVPVDLWYGERDTSPVHSPDRGAFLARRIPSARRTVLPDAGGAIVWTHAREILGSLKESWRSAG